MSIDLEIKNDHAVPGELASNSGSSTPDQELRIDGEFTSTGKREEKGETAEIEKVVKDATMKTSEAVPALSETTLGDLESKREMLYENVSAEVKKVFGIGAVVEDLEARTSAWRTENINEALDIEARARREENKKSDKEALKRHGQKGGKESAKDAQRKSLLDAIIEKILKFLGLEPAFTPKRSAKIKGKAQPKSSRRVKKKESFLIRFLKATGLLP